MSAPTTEGLSSTGALLREVFPGSRVGGDAYLRWLYSDNPAGPVVETNLDDDVGRGGHYAVVPVPLSIAGESVPAALSLNTAVHERARGGGVFTRLAEDTYTLAAERGCKAIIGVANANSTPGFLKRLGFSLLGPLPVQVVAPLPGPSRLIRTGLPDDARLSAMLANSGSAPVWTPERLRWRLASPGARYAVHDGGDWLAVTTADRERAANVAVILAVLSQRKLGTAESAALVRRACRVHRAPVALHAGFNDHLALPALPLPDRFRPSPLNLIFRWLDRETPAPAFTRFEFLDFDAY